MSSKQRLLRSLPVILMAMSMCFLLWRSPRARCSERSQLQDMVHLVREDVGELQACSAIIQDDLDGVAIKDFNKLMASKHKKNPLTESFYLNATQACSSFVRDRGFLSIPLSKEEKEFPIAYSMVIHEKIEMFERLLRAIYTPQNVYCVHVDRKSPPDYLKAVMAIASCLPNVFVASKLESVVYASWSRVQADLNCMQDLLKSPIKWRYLLNTCGTDFPLKTNAEIVQALKALNGKNSMESETNNYKKGRWQYHYEVRDSVIQTDVKKSPPPISTPMFAGNAYFVVTREFVEYLFKSPEVQALIEWAKDTYSPDEHLWATLQRMPLVPGSNSPSNKYEASDMNAIARLVKWSYHEGNLKNGAPYPPCTGVHRHAVCVYGAGDLSWLVQQHHLLANKFDPEVDDVAIKCIEAHLRYKAIYGQSLLTIKKTEIMKR